MDAAPRNVGPSGKRRGIPVLQRRVILRPGEGNGGPVFSGERGLHVVEPRMEVERSEHRFAQALHRHVLVLLAGGTCAEAAEDRLVGMQEKSVERLVVVELEERQIHAVAVDDPDADEQVHQVRDLVLLLQHALVELAAGHARHTAEDDHERLAPEPRLLDRARQVVVDPARRGGEGLHVLHHLVLGVGGVEN